METAEIKLEIFRYIDKLDVNKLNKIYDLIKRNLKIEEDFWQTLTD